MRFRLWEEGIVREEDDVILKVCQYNDEVRVDIVNEKGEWEWCLAEFKDGGLRTSRCVSYDEFSRGVQLDEFGQIKVDMAQEFKEE